MHLAGPLEKDFIQYRKVEGEGQLRYEAHIPSWSQNFEAGEPGLGMVGSDKHLGEIKLWMAHVDLFALFLWVNMLPNRISFVI